MILQLPANAPAIAHIGTATLLVLHVGGGALGIAAGTVAMVARKGRPVHRTAGKVFVAAMLTMAGVAACVAPFLSAPWTNTTAAVLTFYLVVTGWAAARRPPGTSGLLERLALVVPLGVVTMVAGLWLTFSGTPRLAGFASVFVFAGLAALAVWGDVRTLRRGGLVGPARTARHLWRLGAAFAIALGSFFIGQQEYLPKAVQGTPLVGLPMGAAIVAIIAWQVRARWPRGRRTSAA